MAKLYRNDHAFSRVQSVYRNLKIQQLFFETEYGNVQVLIALGFPGLQLQQKYGIINKTM